MGFALWIDGDDRLAWVSGTHEYRPWGAAVVAVTDQFRPRDFNPARRAPAHLRNSFAGFFGSLEEVNECLRRARGESARLPRPGPTPSHVR
ncbi:MAG TPA: hypothetical protein VMJ34_08325 [Bryobacteraceae bacterium]|nr:hypothetical protein [Bryobacteraceae bacterium]